MRREIMDDKQILELYNARKEAAISETADKYGRYWYLSSYREIAKDFAMSENNARTVLLRIRSKLKKYLEKEGIVL